MTGGIRRCFFNKERSSKDSGLRVGKVHRIGKRSTQQDCFGIGRAGRGWMAVVADGMGGLSDGEKVSGKVVQSFLEAAAEVAPGFSEEYAYLMEEIALKASQEVNEMLGRDGLYKSGSTVVSTLIEDGKFYWVSVGDSRIYLYRKNELRQLNIEHIYEAELMKMAENGEISNQDVQTNPNREKLTSFIGMGQLKYIDGSGRGEKLLPGDILLLVTDGVYRTVNDGQLAEILEKSKDVEDAAEHILKKISETNHPYQDNATAVLIDCDSAEESK